MAESLEASEFGSRLRAFFSSIAQPDFKAIGLPRYLYHYTTPEAAAAILETSVFRASSLARMNDAAEYRYAVSVFRAHVDRAFAVEDDLKMLELLSSIKAQLSLGIDADIGKAFAMSLSPDGNEMGMWRLYAARATGFNIAFDLQRLVKWSWHRGLDVIWRCRYGEEQVSAVSQRALRLLKEIFPAANRDHALSAQDAAAYFLSHAARLAVAFKPSVWNDENEWRVVFLNRNPGDAKYFELALPAPDHPEYPIAGICAGPNASASDIARLQDAVRRCGAAHIAQVRSLHDLGSGPAPWQLSGEPTPPREDLL